MNLCHFSMSSSELRRRDVGSSDGAAVSLCPLQAQQLDQLQARLNL